MDKNYAFKPYYPLSQMRTKKAALIIWLVLSAAIYAYWTSQQDKRVVFEKVSRVIDGDTIVLDSGQKLRLLGINAPESGMPGYGQAKNFLKDRAENKTLRIEIFSRDRYGRLLAHIFYKNTHLNEELAKNGLAHIFYYNQDIYYKKIKSAEEFARKNGIGIWKKSGDAKCLELLSLKYDESPKKRCSGNEELVLKNSCEKDLKVTIKDEATHIYKETIPGGKIFSKNFSCVFNNDGDSLFIRDNSGLLLFYRYPE